jgi:hypothetical protein
MVLKQVRWLEQTLELTITKIYCGYCIIKTSLEYDKQDQQGKAAFNERNPHTTQQQEPVGKSPGGPQTKTGQGTISVNTKLISEIFHLQTWCPAHNNNSLQ